MSSSSRTPSSRHRLLVRERLREERRRVGLPRQVGVRKEQRQGLACAAEPLHLVDESLEPDTELCAALGGVEVVGE